MHRRQFLTLSAAIVATPMVSSCDSGPEKFPVVIKPNFTQSGFGPKSTAEEVTEGLDLSGKNVLVTGCNSGLGYETMRVLALRGAHVIGTGRTVEKARDACASVEGNTTPMVLELTDFNSIVNCAKEVLKLGIPLDMLICNAGISGRQEKQLVHGIEKAFLVNYLGHFLLVNKLISAVAAAEQGRIVHLSSSAAYTRPLAAGIRFDSLGESDGGVEYDSWEYYGQSKLACALFSLKLAEKYADTNITSNALHPGFVQTNIDRGQEWYIRTAFKVLGPFIAKTLEEGAATTCYAASHPNMANISGQFLYDSNVVAIGGDNHLENHALADRLWEYSEELLADYIS
jgi:NAD(P)-dependent dehydrogenase (short-subunit alcohol dehydrogenase family)